MRRLYFIVFVWCIAVSTVCQWFRIVFMGHMCLIFIYLSNCFYICGYVHNTGVIEVVLNNLRLKLQQYLAPPRADTEITRIDRSGNVTRKHPQY